MNNDAALSSAAAPDPAADTPEPQEQSGDDERPDTRTPAQKRVQLQAKMKYDFILGLMSNLDIIVYVELCVLYYMDCSLFRLLLRSLPQLVYLTPKLGLLPPGDRVKPQLTPILFTNGLCILLHILTARSEAGEAMRGYLHGGVIIDLIGQKGPTSKLHLVLLDMLVLFLQSFMLVVHMEKDRLVAILAVTIIQADLQNAVLARAAAEISQDHDAEERGVLRDDVMDNDDIEMQSMAGNSSASSRRQSSGNQDRSAGNEEHRSLLQESRGYQSPDSDADEFPLDNFWSGSAVIADFHFFHALRASWNSTTTMASPLQSIGSSPEQTAAIIARHFVARQRTRQNGNTAMV